MKARTAVVPPRATNSRNHSPCSTSAPRLRYRKPPSATNSTAARISTPSGTKRLIERGLGRGSGIADIWGRQDRKCQSFAARPAQLCVRSVRVSPGLVLVAERRELGQVLDLLRHHLALLGEERGDGAAERRIGDPVCA